MYDLLLFFIWPISIAFFLRWGFPVIIAQFFLMVGLFVAGFSLGIAGQFGLGWSIILTAAYFLPVVVGETVWSFMRAIWK